MLVEITLLQQFVFLLGHPIYTLVISLTVLLIATAIGSSLVAGSPDRKRPSGGLCLLAVALALLVYLGIYDWWIHLFVGQALWLRVLATVVVIAPIGILLGMPMPLAIQRISRDDAGLVPWGWAMNGGSSVLGSGLAMALSIHYGYRVTLLVSVGVYVIAAGFFWLGARGRPVVHEEIGLETASGT